MERRDQVSGISARRQIEIISNASAAHSQHRHKGDKVAPYTTHTHTHRQSYMLAKRPAGRLQRHESQYPYHYATTHTNKHIVLLEYRCYRHFDISLTKGRKSEGSAWLC